MKKFLFFAVLIFVFSCSGSNNGSLRKNNFKSKFTSRYYFPLNEYVKPEIQLNVPPEKLKVKTLIAPGEKYLTDRYDYAITSETRAGKEKKEKNALFKNKSKEKTKKGGKG